jgi:hypothetical protein
MDLSDFFKIILAAAGWIWGIWSYLDNKKKDRQLGEFKTASEFIMNEKFSRVQNMIEQEDTFLEKILNKLNTANNPHAASLLTAEERDLRQELDRYINFLECIATARKSGSFKRVSSPGFWDYYLGRLRAWEALWKYVSYEEYGWKNIVKELEKKS